MSSDLSSEITLPTGEKYIQPTGLFINNEFVPSTSSKKIITVNPATAQPICELHAASAQDVDRAVKVAHETFEKTWSKVTGSERGELLIKLSQLIERDAEILAKIDALNAGKPYATNAMNDIGQILELTKFYAGYADKLDGKYIPISENKFVYEINEPLGVVGLIVPWNYPLAMASWKLQGALAAGNTVVIKSAENTPMSLLYFAQLIKEAGFPPGAVNILSGFGPITGSAMVGHELIDKISFTGSTGVGKLIQQQASVNLKNVTLECGGKSPAVIFKDANLSEAVKWCSLGIFYNSGQNCTANSRILVQDEVYDEFIQKFQEYTKENWVLGDPFKDETTVGPVISKTHHERILSYLNHGSNVEKLNKIEIAPLGSTAQDYPQGYYITPTIFTDVPVTSKLFQEEIFGPVACVTKFSDFEEAIKIANSSIYGLGSAVFTKNIKKAHRFARMLKAGTVWINSSNDEDIKASFGGYKMSGVGREMGLEGIKTYTQIKAIHVNLDDEEEEKAKL
ncbi:hypothetical protein WICPIJ_004443 [Wickerhamomyces pijperi]|uniref:Aldehyde dehydrogenase domain-containing protein n=1 Tax=Wickerhamomyces pijperi TaxID=599730 RepID=A0A9P8Q5G4_WICPI|nr:hypothetical protein WICPIJ_004443 [Wickerhamomyces pijperi]